MSHAQPTNPNNKPAPNNPSAEAQEAKRLEKLQAHSSSHRTAGTHEAPRQPTAGILKQLETERGHG